MKNILIVGAGLAGLLAANMLRRYRLTIVETQPELPNNHSALLRFRTSQVGDALGIPFQKVTVRKYAMPWRNPLADALAYSRKVTGVSRLDRSILSADGQPVERYIAPPDLVKRMAEPLDIHLNSMATPDQFDRYDAIISTIPLPNMLDMLDFDHDLTFRSFSGINLICRVDDLEAYATLYVPDPSYPFSRVSITGDTLIAECNFSARMDDLNADDIHDAMYLLGIPYASKRIFQIKPQKYAKILPIDDFTRRTILFKLTDQHNIFSLGRFATWRPGLLLDSLIHDLRLIERWIDDPYTMRIHRTQGE